MPRDISSSSSEEEEEDRAAGTQRKQQEEKKKTKYQCPADFVSFCHAPCGSTLAKSLRNNNNELWLIKAPANFNPECFSGIKVPLSGLGTVKVPTGEVTAAGGQQIYSILASSHGTSDLHLLTSDKKPSDGVVFGPAFSGLLNVCESYGNTSANWTPQVIPTAPAPSIPPELKQRFQPFGCKAPAPTCVAENEVDGAALGPSSTALRPLAVKRFIEEAGAEEEGEGTRKKKKKKKEKQIKMEQEGTEEPVKVEPEIQDEVMTELPDEKRKKKKKKKDKEREEVEEGLDPSVQVKVEEVTVKCEPMDPLYMDGVEGLVKKKKKKKKSKTDDD